MEQRPDSDEAANQGVEGADTPGGGRSTSIFDAAQGLLQAAIDEVRTSGPATPPTPPARPAADSDAPRPAWPTSVTPRPAGRVEKPKDTGFWARAAVPEAPVATESAVPEPPVATQSAVSEPPVATQSAGGEPLVTPGSRRRRASTTRPSAVAVPETTDDFDGLTDTLFQPTTKGTRRRRRPEAVSVDAFGATAAVATSGVMPAPFPSALTAPSLEATATPKTDSPGTRAPEPPGTAEWELAAAGLANPVLRGPGPSPSAATDQLGPAPRRRTIWVAAAAIAAVVAVFALGLVLTGGDGSDEAVVVASGKAELRFEPITTPEGATVNRSWALEGRKGREFVGTLSFSNPTSAPLSTTFTEVIPKSLAANVSQITFDPQPIVIKADPVVQYRLTVPARSTTTATYEIAVAPEGVDRRRLVAWAEDLPTEPTTTTTTTTTAPALLPTTEATTVPTSAPGRANSGNTGGGSTNRPSNPSNPPSPTAPPTSPPEPPPTSPPEPPPTNPPVVKGTIVIQVITRGSQDGTFGYSTPFGAISLTTSGGGASWAAEIDSGAYTLAQISTPDFFYLYEIRCSNGFASSHTTTASITVQSGATTSCTFENRPA